ncbi:unnamed protein product [Phytophthora fragariaefolia]|uniref:Unnamed protein product n=1 Tax=Phytophthora fragariaefolia TaxID=1490495 RepID=A0A9W6TZX4_9STRA|nr:unnamed protein product [Phytophthora fragariaefolia]
MVDSRGAVRRRRHVKTVENSGLLDPKGIAASADGRHLFVCDTGHHRIKFAALPSRSALAQVDDITHGVDMFVLAGTGKKGWRDGPALEASFNSPLGVCEYEDGTIIVADTGNHCIRQIRRSANGKLVVKTIAGAYAKVESEKISVPLQRVGHGGTAIGNKRISGFRDGERSLFRSPSAIIAGPDGELLVADTMNNCIRGVLPPLGGRSPWRAITVCGQTRPGHTDGNCEVALFDQPISLCWGMDSNTFFVADRGNACIRQIGRSYGDGLSFAWVRTIDVGVTGPPRSIYHCTNPLGMVYTPWQLQEDSEVIGQLVVCDGGDNVIKLLPLGELSQQTAKIKEYYDTLRPVKTTTIRSTDHEPRSESKNYEESLVSVSYVVVFVMLLVCFAFTIISNNKTCWPRTDSENMGEENQLGSDDCGGVCACEASQALEEALKANEALRTENLRLRELLQCTFDEVLPVFCIYRSCLHFHLYIELP